MLIERIASALHLNVILANTVLGAAAAAVWVAYSTSQDSVAQVDDSASMMNFAQNGALRCICQVADPNGSGLERRQFCRTCSFEVVQRDETLLNKQLGVDEIRGMTRSLKAAAKLARNLEIPSSIQDIHGFEEWMASDEQKDKRTPPTQASGIRRLVH